MNIEYDPEVDALYVRLTNQKIIESEAIRPGIILDFDVDGQVAGIEVLHASKRTRELEPMKLAA